MKKVLDVSVLYVEDEPVVREAVEDILKIRLKNVYVAENGKAALDFLGSSSVDLIITDIRMPEMDGLTMIEQLRNQDVDIPVIITTAFDDSEYLLKAIDLKVDKFIKKPIRAAALLETAVELSQMVLQKRACAIDRDQIENYRKVIELSNNKMMHLSAEGDILEVSEGLSEYLKHHAEGNAVPEKLDEILDAQTYAQLLREIAALQIFNEEVSLSLGDEQFSATLTAFPAEVEDELPTRMTVLFRNIVPFEPMTDHSLRASV